MTASYAGKLQQSVNHGARAWMRNPSQVSEAFARFIRWPTVTGGSLVLWVRNGHAEVSVRRRDSPSVELRVALAQPGSTVHSIWSVTGCHTAFMRLTSPGAGTAVISPAVVRGRASVFEGQFAVVMLDTRWRVVGRSDVHVAGSKMTFFRVRIGFRDVGTYRVLEAYALSPKDGSLSGIAITKVRV